MNSKHPCGAMAAWCVGFVLLVPGLWAQKVAAPRPVGVPQDWSERQVVFSLKGLAQHPEMIDKEPRIRHQMMQRFPGSNSNSFHGAAGAADVSGRAGARSKGENRDWEFDLVHGHVSANEYPAKFTFDPSAPPDCTNDYVVFGLGIPGVTGGQANLVAFNNLYVNSANTGYCPGTTPNVMFAYNVSTPGATGSRVTLSPVISENGKKIAFVETATSGAIFHVLTWSASDGGTVTDAVAPTSAEMVNIPLVSNDISSSPWVDYGSDTGYVGANGGSLFKFTGVFLGPPAIASGWPFTVSSGHQLGSPVLDNRLGMLMVGSSSGELFQIDISTNPGTIANTLIVGDSSGTDPGLVTTPLVDVTNGTTFVVNADDGTSAVLVQAETSNIATGSVKARIGVGAAGGTKLNIRQPAFSNGYYTDPSDGTINVCGTGTGVIVDAITATSITANVLTVTANNTFAVGEQVTILGTDEAFLNGVTVTVASLIGTAPNYTGFTANFTQPDYSNPSDTGTVSGGDTSPWQFAFGFTGNTMNIAPVTGFPVQLSTSTTDVCSGWTEFFNPFVGATDSITATSVASDVLTVTANNSNLTVGEVVYIQGTAESFLNGQAVTVASLIGTGPTYTGFTANFTAADYSNGSDTGAVTAGTDFFFFGLTADCTMFLTGVTNGCVVALSSDPTIPTASVALAGGPSGIVVDNYSTAAQASSIYLTAERAADAYKFTQNGLQ